MQFKASSTPAEIEELLGLIARTPEKISSVTMSIVGENLYDSQMPNGVPGKWTHVWDMALGTQEEMKAYGPHPYHMEILVPFFVPENPKCIIANQHHVWFETTVKSTMNRDTRPRKQALTYQFRENITPQQIERFDAMMLDMPKAMPLIRNWCLGTGIQTGRQRPFDRMWEWEFMTDEDFQIYLDHKTHVDVVPFFMDDDPACLIANRTNGQIQLDSSLITY